MTAANLAPTTTWKSWTNNGQPNVGGLLYTYAAGTSTPIATYTDSTAGTPNTNPVVFNSRGEANVWLLPNTGYKFIEQDSAGNTIKTTDSVYQNALLTLSGGTDTGQPNAYVLNFAAPYTGYSNGICIFWLPSNNNTGASTINVNGIGVVPLVNPNGSALGANQIIANQMTEIVYSSSVGGFELVSLGNFTGSTIGTFGTETPLTSAATTDLGSALAHVVNVTGTTTITSFGSSASIAAPIYVVRFTASLTLTYSATTMILPGGASIVTSAGDSCLAEYLGAGAWKVLIYQYANGGSNQKIKASDTVITSSTTLTADPDLVSNTLAVGRYSFEVYLVFDSVSAPTGFKWTNVGTAVDSRGLAPATAYGYVNSAAYGPKSETPYGTTITYATVSNTANSNVVMYKGSLLVGTAGTFGVSWAQSTSTPSATTLRAGSYLTLQLLNTGSSANQVTRTYSTAGSGTETIPVGYTTVTIEAWGASAGGNVAYLVGGTSGGGGGGSGGYCKSVLSVSGLGGQTMTYVVGAAGAVAFNGAASTVTAGTFSMTTMTAGGGNTGTAASSLAVAGTGGTGGTASGGATVNTPGNPGGGGTNNGGGGFGGSGGPGVSGVYGGGRSGGLGGGIAIARAGGDGTIIFTYQ